MGQMQRHEVESSSLQLLVLGRRKMCGSNKHSIRIEDVRVLVGDDPSPGSSYAHAYTGTSGTVPLLSSQVCRLPHLPVTSLGIVVNESPQLASKCPNLHAQVFFAGMQQLETNRHTIRKSVGRGERRLDGMG